MDPIVVGFLLGAPIWVALGAILFGSLCNCADRERGRELEAQHVQAEATFLTNQLIAGLRAQDDPDVLSMRAYKKRRGLG